MIIDFGGFEFDLGEENVKIETVFPLSYEGYQLLVKIGLEQLDSDDLFQHYSCGDTLNHLGQLVAGTHCKDEPTFRINMKLVTRTAGEEEEEKIIVENLGEIVQVHESTTVACKEHALVSLLQVIFMSGLLISQELQ